MAGSGSPQIQVFPGYVSQTLAPDIVNTLILGGSTKGSAFDVTVQFADAAEVRPVIGSIVYDCVH